MQVYTWPLTELYLTQVQFILHNLEEEYRQSVIERLAALGEKVPPGVDPLDLAIDLDSDENSSDMGELQWICCAHK